MNVYALNHGFQYQPGPYQPLFTTMVRAEEAFASARYPLRSLLQAYRSSSEPLLSNFFDFRRAESRSTAWSFFTSTLLSFSCTTAFPSYTAIDGRSASNRYKPFFSILAVAPRSTTCRLFSG